MTSFFVNGKTVHVDVDRSTPLLWVLRESLGLTGTKFGCEMAPETVAQMKIWIAGGAACPEWAREAEISPCSYRLAIPEPTQTLASTFPF